MGTALVFPGQGAQRVGMGMELAERFPSARRLLDEADDALDFALSDIIANGPDDELTRTDISQPAILVVSHMAFTVLGEVVKPLRFDACAGLSLGEYTALVAAEALSYADAVRLVRLRGQAMQEAALSQPSGMVALVGADEATATALCAAVAEGQVLSVANLNCPGQVVISGAQAACQRAVDAARAHGIRRALPLKVAGAFHSALMAPAAERLAAAIDQAPIADPVVPIYHNVDGRPAATAAEVADRLLRQLTSPVRWADGVIAMHAAGCGTFIELGPGTTLSGMIPKTVKGVEMLHLDGPEDAFGLVNEL